jgi:glycosyltransferase involved in cell wall biosynthesis
MKDISIDLIICTYNNASFLDRALIAMSGQRVPPEVEWRVLVVNNNCTDQTCSVVERHIESGRIPNLSMVFEPKQGLTPARLCGVKNTMAEWLAFVDDDCLLEEDWVAQAARFALAHPDCGAFGGRVVLSWQTPPPAYVLKYGYSFAEQDHGMLPKQVGCLVGTGVVIRRSVLSACGWVKRQFLADRIGNQLISGGDVEMALRIAARNALWYNPECKLSHVIPSTRISEKYLMAINRGLGTSKLYGDSMLWPGRYQAWLVLCVFEALRFTVGMMMQTLRIATGRSSRVEAAIAWSFLQGWCTGISGMLRMDTQDRRALLGCAKRTRQQAAPGRWMNSVWRARRLFQTIRQVLGSVL